MGKRKIRIGIVGSRRRNTLNDRNIVGQLIVAAVFSYGKKNVTVVSGGARGPDTFAEEEAKLHGLDFAKHPVPPGPYSKKWEFRQAAFARNEEIVRDSDVIFALVHPDRKGGTENTVEHAIRLKKTIYLVTSDGRLYLPEEWHEGEKADQARDAQAEVPAGQGKGSPADRGQPQPGRDEEDLGRGPR